MSGSGDEAPCGVALLALLGGCGGHHAQPAAARTHTVAEVRAVFARHGIRLERLPPALQTSRTRTELDALEPSLSVTVYRSAAAAAHPVVFLLGNGKPHVEIRGNVVVSWVGHAGPRLAAALADLSR